MGEKAYKFHELERIIYDSAGCRLCFFNGKRQLRSGEQRLMVSISPYRATGILYSGQRFITLTTRIKEAKVTKTFQAATLQSYKKLGATPNFGVLIFAAHTLMSFCKTSVKSDFRF